MWQQHKGFGLGTFTDLLAKQPQIYVSHTVCPLLHKPVLLLDFNLLVFEERERRKNGKNGKTTFNFSLPYFIIIK